MRGDEDLAQGRYDGGEVVFECCTQYGIELVQSEDGRVLDWVNESQE